MKQYHISLFERRYIMVLKTNRTITMLEGHDDVAKRFNKTQVGKAISRGEKLLKLKDKVPRKDWDQFVEEHIKKHSAQSCNNFMMLAREKIHENHYKHGIPTLLQFIKKGYDLSTGHLVAVLTDNEWSALSSYAA